MELEKKTENLKAAEDLLKSIAQKVMNGGDIVIKRNVTIVMNRISTATRVLIAWPFIILLLSMIGYKFAQIAVPIVTLVSFMIVLFIMTSRWPLGILIAETATIEMTAAVENNDFRRFVRAARSAINGIRLVAGIELLFGLYCSLVPVANDRVLALVMVIAIEAIVCFIGIDEWLVIGLACVVAIITLILISGGRDNLHIEKANMKLPTMDWGKSNSGKKIPGKDNLDYPNPAVVKSVTYTRSICSNATLQSYADRIIKPGDPAITIDPKESCYGSMVVLPQTGAAFAVQQVAAAGDYASVWCNGKDNPFLPVPATTQGQLEAVMNQCKVPCIVGLPCVQTISFRLQGKGEVDIRVLSMRPEKRVDENGYGY